MPLKKLCEMCEELVRPADDGDCPKCGAGLQRVPADLMSALRDALPASPRSILVTPPKWSKRASEGSR